MAETLCGHDRIETFTRLARITEREGGPVTRFMLDVQTRCGDCGTRFAFVGLDAGYSPDRPTTSVSRFELRAPVEPDAHATSLLAETPETRFPTLPTERQVSDGR